MRSPVQSLAKALKEKKLTIAFAESMTCGLVTHKLGTISGTADVLAGSVVCYSELMKTEVPGIKRQLISKHTAESQKVTDALARNLPKHLTANIYAAVTGLASPGGSETSSKPVGTVFYAVFYKRKLFRLKRKFNGSPLQIKIKACNELFNFILKVVEQN